MYVLAPLYVPLMTHNHSINQPGTGEKNTFNALSLTIEYVSPTKVDCHAATNMGGVRASKHPRWP